VTAYLPRMVILKPTSGEACTTSDAVEEEAYVRKGAASFAWLFALPLLWLRRRVKK
jgi:nitrate reductase gamma subunit